MRSEYLCDRFHRHSGECGDVEQTLPEPAAYATGRCTSDTLHRNRRACMMVSTGRGEIFSIPFLPIAREM